MPVILDRLFSDRRRDIDDDASGCITIGLINNMSDEALKATERQYLSLLGAASDGMLIRLYLYTLPGVSRTESIERHTENLYSNIDELWGNQLDGLIVTGREPLTANLMDELYWDSFTRLLEWAQENTHATVWSCLAAHAAILHMDGISRVKRNDKLFGIFECARVDDHPLTAGTASRFKLPHSRWNGVPEEELTAAGYTVLTRAANAGVDTFIKQQNSLFVFFQGHPEYEADTLLREYRRDVGRYLRGESDRYPLMPRSYFDAETAAALTSLQERAASGGTEDLPPELARTLEKIQIENTWCAGATTIYRNWLGHICAEKQRAQRSSLLDSSALQPGMFVG